MTYPPNVRGVHSIVLSPDGVCSYMLCGVTIVRRERGRVAGCIQIANDFFTFSKLSVDGYRFFNGHKIKERILDRYKRMMDKSSDVFY